MRSKPLAIAVASLVVACTATEAAGYCLAKVSGTNPYVAWTTMPVTYRVSDSLTDPALLQAIDQAFQTWGSVPCATLTFAKGTQFTMCTQTPCPSGTVAFQHNAPAIHIYWYNSATGYPTSPLFVAYMYFVHDTLGALVSGSIAINAFNYNWNATGGSVAPATLDVQNELTAFIGHVIGLDDSTVPTATMYPSISYGDTSKRVLDPDDIDGLTYLYPLASCPAPPPPGPNGCSTTPAPDGGPPADAGPPADLGPSPDGSDAAPVDAGPLPDGVVPTEASTGEGVSADGPTGDASAGDGPVANDGPVAGDGPGDGPAQPVGDGAGVADGPAGGEGPTVDLTVGEGLPPPADSGCCRVGHARQGELAGPLLLALLLLGLLRRRRRL